MKTLEFKQVDVFTDIPYLGNPVAVLFEADGLTDEEMLRVANWTNLSETVFVTKSERADFGLRIFTPRQELPFAGHPTIGSAHAVREAGIVHESAHAYQMECRAGVVPLRVQGDVIMARVPDPRVLETICNTDSIAAVLGCDRLADQSASVIDAGPIWMVARVESQEQLYDLKPDSEQLMDLSKRTGSIGVCVFALGVGSQIHVRTFAPRAGIYEDPVCGSGNAAIALYLREGGFIEKLGAEYTANQGMALKRNGIVRVRVTEDDIMIGGQAVTVIDGRITLPPPVVASSAPKLAQEAQRAIPYTQNTFE